MDILPEFKATKKGVLVTDQDIGGAGYTYVLPGDLTGMGYWEKDTREIGAWSAVFVGKITSDEGAIKPLANISGETNGDFSAKMVTKTPPTDSYTQAKNLGDDTPKKGDYGLILQGIDQDKHCQFYFPLTPGGVSTVYAKICWSVTINGDYSVAEIMSYNLDLAKWETTEVVWIDFARSRTVRNETAGDDTIFEIRLVESDKIRDGISHDLYCAVRCYEDFGKKITHCQTRQKTGGDYVIANYLSTDLIDPVWNSAEAARIKTTIDRIEKENIVPARLPDEWEIGFAEDFLFMEVDSFQSGKAIIFRPIRPVLDDLENKIYNSAIEISGNSIAKYRRK